VYTGFWWEDQLGDLGVDGRIILRLVFREWDVWMDRAGPGYGQLAGTC
jgi:hypothetical protein